LALSSSRALPLNTCPALRPRWCPQHSPSIASRTAAFRYMHTVGFRSLLTQISYPIDHDDPDFGAQSHSLYPLSVWLRTPLTGLPADFSTALLATLWAGGTFTHWKTTSNFLGLRPIPTIRAYLDTIRVRAPVTRRPPHRSGREGFHSSGSSVATSSALMANQTGDIPSGA